MTKVLFRIGDVTIESEFRDTPTARRILEALPLASSGSYWGGEFYFEVPVTAPLEADATDVVEPGTVAFWSVGRCICLFCGPTPASRSGECRAASAVNLVGKVLNPEALSDLRVRDVQMETA